MADASIKRIFAVANQKGGVGKTTTTISLGAALAEQGRRVLIVDLDPQGNATTGVGVDARKFERSMYDVLLNDVPADRRRGTHRLQEPLRGSGDPRPRGRGTGADGRHLAASCGSRSPWTSVDGDFDYVFIDCPPSLGLITINAFAAATDIMVPVQCEFYALEGLTQLQRIVDLVQRNLNASAQDHQGDLDHVRPSQYAHPGRGQGGQAPLPGRALPDRHSEDRPLRRGAVIRPTHHGVRPQLQGSQGVHAPSRRRSQWLRRSGLGKGLGALIPDNATGARTSPPPDSSGPLRQIAVTKIHPNQFQPRQVFKGDSLDVPGGVDPRTGRPATPHRPAVGRYRGGVRAHRRGAPVARRRDRGASRRCPCWSQDDVNDRLSLEQAVVENLHRVDLHPLEEAAAYQQLVDEFDLTHEQVATRVGKSRATVTNTLRLLQLGEPAQVALASDRSPPGTRERCSPLAIPRRRPHWSIVSSRATSRCGRRRRRCGAFLEPRPITTAETVEGRDHHVGPQSSSGARRQRGRAGAAPGGLPRHAGSRRPQGPQRQIIIDFADLDDLERLY